MDNDNKKTPNVRISEDGKCEGWLSKEGHFVKNWKRRWFVVEDGFLSYYKSPTHSRAKGSLPLKGGIVQKSDKKEHCFSLTTPQGKYLLMKAESETERAQWMDVFDTQSSALVETSSNSSTHTSNDFELPDGESKKYVLKDFELIKVIGRGAFGKVMLVKLKGTENLFAMKILSKPMLIKRRQVERTKAENKILRKVAHPFMVGIRYAFQSPEKLYLVLDYVNGGDLFVHLQRLKRFDVDQVRLYTAEILLAFEHLHKQDVIYRDLKPENILMTHEGHICLTDFGLVKENIGVSDKTNSFCGTPEYLAPEIILDKGYGKDVDWWALGVLAYEMLVGRPPFYSENTNTMYEKIKHEPLRFPSHVNVPEDAKELIEALLNRDAAQRLGSGKGDAEEIKGHQFFVSIDFDKLMKKDYDPKYKPKLKGEEDVSNFDPCFTKEAPVLTVVNSHISQKQQQQFDGFTYVADSQMSVGKDDS